MSDRDTGTGRRARGCCCFVVGSLSSLPGFDSDPTASNYRSAAKQPQPSTTVLAHTMAKASAVLFLSAMFSFLLKEGLPFVLPPPSTPNAVIASSSWAGARGISPTAAVGRPARISARRGSQTTMSMADVCHGDFPTPGWVRMAQRNLARVSVGDQLPDSTVRYGCVLHALFFVLTEVYLYE